MHTHAHLAVSHTVSRVKHDVGMSSFLNAAMIANPSPRPEQPIGKGFDACVIGDQIAFAANRTRA